MRGSTLPGLVLLALAVLPSGCIPSPPQHALDTQLSVCSFNINFLGHYKSRDDVSLATLLKDFDIVVVQELVAPPYPLTYPDGTAAHPDAESARFFDQMTRHGFKYWLSEEDTGPGDTIHTNATSTEWWVAFYKPEAVQTASDLPWGFLADDRSNDSDYDRVPYAFSFRTSDGTLDFVLISVHLRAGGGSLDMQRRSQGVRLIVTWTGTRASSEKDFIILGDMNIESSAELATFVPAPYASLNAACVATNTSPSSPKPYDQVLVDPSHTHEVDTAYGFRVTRLVDALEPTWRGPGAYPGDPYDASAFGQLYSDHNPVSFAFRLPGFDDD
jgi:exonuclease III